MFMPAYNKHTICSVNATLFLLMCVSVGHSSKHCRNFFFFIKFSLEFFSCFSVFHQLSLPNQQVLIFPFGLFFAHLVKKRVMEVISHKAGWKINQDEEGKYTHTHDVMSQN